MALRKVTLIALGVSVSLLMGCPARMRQWDSANKLEVELSEEQEVMLHWLDQNGIEHVRVVE